MLGSRGNAAAGGAAAVLCLFAGTAFVAPGRAPVRMPSTSAGLATVATAAPGTEADSRDRTIGWGTLLAGFTVSAHLGLVAAYAGRTALRARGGGAPPNIKPGTAMENKYFEDFFVEYTAEYMKTNMYQHEDKLPGFGVAPILDDNYEQVRIRGRDGTPTSSVLGNLKNVGSKELGYASILCLGIGLWGNLQFLIFDPQFAAVDAGGSFNAGYAVAAYFLPISFFAHIGAFIQKLNGK